MKQAGRIWKQGGQRLTFQVFWFANSTGQTRKLSCASKNRCTIIAYAEVKKKKEKNPLSFFLGEDNNDIPVYIQKQSMFDRPRWDVMGRSWAYNQLKWYVFIYENESQLEGSGQSQYWFSGHFMRNWTVGRCEKFPTFFFEFQQLSHIIFPVHGSQYFYTPLCLYIFLESSHESDMSSMSRSHISIYSFDRLLRIPRHLSFHSRSPLRSFIH